MKIVHEKDVPTYVSRGRIAKTLADPNTGARAISLTVVTFPPGERSEEHAKEATQEIIYVLSGQLTLITREAQYQLGPGSLAMTDLNEPHVHANLGNEPLRIMVILSPAGHEQLFKQRQLLADVPEDDLSWQPQR